MGPVTRAGIGLFLIVVGAVFLLAGLACALQDQPAALLCVAVALVSICVGILIHSPANREFDLGELEPGICPDCSGSGFGGESPDATCGTCATREPGSRTVDLRSALRSDRGEVCANLSPTAIAPTCAFCGERPMAVGNHPPYGMCKRCNETADAYAEMRRLWAEDDAADALALATETAIEGCHDDGDHRKPEGG